MKTKFSEDIVPLSDLKVNPGKVIKHSNETHRPILLTSRGRGVAVVQSLQEYEKTEEELVFIKSIAQGLMEVKEGNSIELSEAKKKLGL